MPVVGSKAAAVVVVVKGAVAVGCPRRQNSADGVAR